jgi:hypothetical protein
MELITVPINLFSSPPSLKLYQRYRAALKPLHHKIIEAYVDKAILEKAARALQLSGGRQLILASEDDMAVLMDYGIYEIKVNRQNLVQRYQAEKSEQSDIERELLEAMAGAKTGLFKVQQVDARKSQVTMQELTGEQRQVILTDINFSRTLFAEVILFFRALELGSLTMTTGVAFTFPASAEERLLRRWKNWVAVERYAGCFMLSKRHGIETRYE